MNSNPSADFSVNVYWQNSHIVSVIRISIFCVPADKHVNGDYSSIESTTDGPMPANVVWWKVNINILTIVVVFIQLKPILATIPHAHV